MAGFIRGTFKRHFNIKQWMGLSTIVDNFRFVPEIYKRITTPEEALYTETFEEAVIRLNLDKNLLTLRKREYFRASVIYFICGIVALMYASTFIFRGVYHGFLMGAVVSCILFTHAFRAHFWYTQIEKQRLGLTLREWVCAFFGY
tara:strand:- start:267 stop:701 length:435 start_codon:yes stop_codon:yes gene_type:complete